MIKKAALYWHTLRHLKMKQPVWRIWRMLRRRCRLYRVPRALKSQQLFDRERLCALRAFLRQANELGIHEGADLDGLRRQSFCFLNRRVENTGVLPWRDTTLPRLWLYHLHGFGFAREFSVNGADDNHLGDRDRVMHWMRDWSATNPIGADIAWDAYPTSERILNWALLIAVFSLREPDIQAAYQQQMQWLSKWIEYDVGANHLLKNAVALTVSAALLGDRRRLNGAMRLLRRELNEQVLDDGGHCERSPMYHALLLWDCLLVCAVLGEVPTFLEETTARMTLFLERMTEPDGEIPLFGDAALNTAPPTPALTALARAFLPARAFATFDSSSAPVPGHAFVHSGFYTMGDKAAGNWMIVKTAPPSPSWQPGHSHGDMLSYVLSVGGKRFIVDSGVHGYAESPYRAYCRSARAHNTVEVNDLEQAEFWSVFRVARRPTALPAHFHLDGDAVSLEAAYDHYAGYRHTRCVQYARGSACWEIHDTIATGRGEARVNNYIHFHPQCRLEHRNDGLRVQRDGCAVRIEALHDARLEIHDTDENPTYWYCPEFGVAHPIPVVLLASTGMNEISTGYRITIE